MGLVRYIVIGVISYIVFKSLRRIVSLVIGGDQAKVRGNSAQTTSEDVIEICPDCGEVQKPRHKCRKQ